MKTFGPRVFISDQNVRLGKSARPENFEHFVDFRRTFGRDFFVVICGTGGQVLRDTHSFTEICFLNNNQNGCRSEIFRGDNRYGFQSV